MVCLCLIIFFKIIHIVLLDTGTQLPFLFCSRRNLCRDGCGLCSSRRNKSVGGTRAGTRAEAWAGARHVQIHYDGLADSSGTRNRRRSGFFLLLSGRGGIILNFKTIVFHIIHGLRRAGRAAGTTELALSEGRDGRTNDSQVAKFGADGFIGASTTPADKQCLSLWHHALH